MRITSSMYYKDIYGNNNSKLSKNLFDVNKQIASGLKIQYAKDDIRTFTETMRLDNEIAVLGQIKDSTRSAYKFSNQSDVALNEFTDSMNRTRTLLIQAANGSNDDVSLDAIAKELRGIEKNFKNLANTSINGQYLFAGSATDTRPITENGEYVGNDAKLNTFTGSNISQQYNLSGAELFLGEDKTNNRTITTNVLNKNLFDDSNLSESSPMRDLMGDKNDISPNTNYFYIRGTKSDGSSFKEKFHYSDTENISTLLKDIGDAYGNKSPIDVVNVTMNDMGEIIIEDKMKGSSKLDFHIVGAIDYTDGTGGLADVNDIDELKANGGETTYPPAGELYVKEFIKSGLISGSEASDLESAVYDRVEFAKDGSFVTANMPQVLKDGNDFAVASTKLSEVADISKGTLDTADDTLAGTSLKFNGKDISGSNYDVKIDFKSAANGGSTFSFDTDGDGNYDDATYDIFDMSTPRKAVDADSMTYKQLMDAMNMVVTNTLPASNTSDDYDVALLESTYKGVTTLTHDGKIQFEDANHGSSKATIAFYDENSDDFTKNSSAMTFNTNNALTIRDPKTNFFESLNEVITSVENYKIFADASSGDVRNVGIENAIAMIDDLQDHISRSQSKVGSQSNSLTQTLERTEILEISSMSLRSSVIDTDLAEASLSLTQLQLNYEAMLSTVGKVSKLSLVNYL